MTNCEYIKNLSPEDFAHFLNGFNEIGRCDFCVHYPSCQRTDGECYDGTYKALQDTNNEIVDDIVQASKDGRGELSGEYFLYFHEKWGRP